MAVALLFLLCVQLSKPAEVADTGESEPLTRPTDSRGSSRAKRRGGTEVLRG